MGTGGERQLGDRVRCVIKNSTMALHLGVMLLLYPVRVPGIIWWFIFHPMGCIVVVFRRWNRPGLLPAYLILRSFIQFFFLHRMLELVGHRGSEIVRC